MWSGWKTTSSTLRFDSSSHLKSPKKPREIRTRICRSGKDPWLNLASKISCDYATMVSFYSICSFAWLSCITRGWEVGEVSPIFLWAQATPAIIQSKVEEELHTLICSIRKTEKRSIGAGMGRGQAFDWAHFDHFVKDNVYFLMILDAKSCIRKKGKSCADLLTSVSLGLLRFCIKWLVPGDKNSSKIRTFKVWGAKLPTTRLQNYVNSVN